MKTGFELLDDAFLNKGTAFTESERKKLGLEGLLPPCVEDIETQAQRIYRQMERKICRSLPAADFFCVYLLISTRYFFSLPP